MDEAQTAPAGATTKKPNKKAKTPPAVKPTVYFRGADVGSNAHGEPALGLFLVWTPVQVGGMTLPPAADASKDGSGSDEPDLSKVGDFTVAFVDGWGYLQNVVPGQNPWKDVFQQLENRAAAPVQTVSQPMTEGLTYRLWPVAHPHPDRVLAVLEYLRTLKQKQIDARNGKKPPADGATPPARFDFSKLKSFDVTLAKVTEGKADLLPIYLPSAASAYWPGGSPKYKGWLLYRHMPYEALAEVRDQTRLAAFHLGALRYPTGAEHSPYLDDKTEATLGKHPGWYSNTILGSVDHFQQAAVKGEAWKMPTAPMPRRQDHPTSCAFLLGEEVFADAKLAEADFFPGVLDSATADVLHAWIQKGLRHRGYALVLLKNNVWGQPPLVFAYWAWDALVRALGCPYGLGISNTWRPFSTTPGAGQTDASNHALGLAIDLACDFDEDYSDRTSSRDKDFPVAFEAIWSRDPQRAERDLRAKQESLRRVETRFAGGAPAPAETDAKVGEAQAAADAAKAAKATNAPQLQAQLKLLQELKKAREAVADAQQKVDELLAVLEPWKLEYELRFRLYGHTTLDFLNLAPEQLVAALDRAFGTQQNDDGPQYRIVDDYRRRLLGMFPTTLSPAHAAMREGIIAPYVETLRATVEHLLTLARQEGAFAAAYVRKTVRPFRSDAWSLDGGDSLPEVEAAKDAEDPKVVALNPQLRATAKAWLNLSRLGWHLGLGNISGRNKDFKRAWKHPLLEANRTLETIKIDGKMPPVEREPPKTPQPYDAYKDHSRRGALGRLAAAIRKIKAEAPDYALTIRDHEGDAGCPAQSFTDGMLAVLESWPPREYQLSDGLTIDAHGLDLVVQVSGETEKRANQGATIAKLLSTGSAMVASIGEGVVSRLTTGAAFTGEQIKTALENAEIAPPSKNAARGEVKTSSRAKMSTLKTTADQMLRLRPVFAPAGVDLWQAKVIVPAAGTPKGLEWWHFEHRRRTGAWPSHMAEIGVSERVITAPKKPESLDGIAVPGSEIKSERGNYPFPDEPSNEVPMVPDGG